jgi:hypothetical protein
MSSSSSDGSFVHVFIRNSLELAVVRFHNPFCINSGSHLVCRVNWEFSQLSRLCCFDVDTTVMGLKTKVHFEQIIAALNENKHQKINRDMSTGVSEVRSQKNNTKV